MKEMHNEESLPVPSSVFNERSGPMKPMLTSSWGKLLCPTNGRKGRRREGGKKEEGGEREGKAGWNVSKSGRSVSTVWNRTSRYISARKEERGDFFFQMPSQGDEPA